MVRPGSWCSTSRGRHALKRARRTAEAQGLVGIGSWDGMELAGPDGASRGEYGPGTVEATRIAIEPMGTPVGTLEELFARFQPGSAEATPAP